MRVNQILYPSALILKHVLQKYLAKDKLAISVDRISLAILIKFEQRIIYVPMLHVS